MAIYWPIGMKFCMVADDSLPKEFGLKIWGCPSRWRGRGGGRWLF